jgi:Tol biopolymer transport system component
MKTIYLTACAIVIFVFQALSQNLIHTDALFVKNRPQIFAPGIISLDNRFETYPAFTPDGKEIYFSVVNADWTEGKILYSKARNGQWTEPKMAVFSDNKYINWESSVSPYGNYLLFTRENRGKTMDIYWVSIKFIDTYRKDEKLTSHEN